MSQSADSWGEEPQTPSSVASSSVSRKISAPTPVRDDWDADDDDDEEDSGLSLEEKNKQIWEDANTKEHHPMPTLVISRGSAVPVITPSLPLNQPPAMKILKRPSATPSPSTTPSTPAGETFKEREARYQLARERIFGSSGEQPATSTDSANKSQGPQRISSSSATPLTAKVVRNPRGPSSHANGSAPDNGFRTRKKAASSELVDLPVPSIDI